MSSLLCHVSSLRSLQLVSTLRIRTLTLAALWPTLFSSVDQACRVFSDQWYEVLPCKLRNSSGIPQPSAAIDEDLISEDKPNVQYVGHQRQAASAGNYFTAEIGSSLLLVTRQMDGRLQAFHNVSS